MEDFLSLEALCTVGAEDSLPARFEAYRDAASPLTSKSADTDEQAAFESKPDCTKMDTSSIAVTGFGLSPQQLPSNSESEAVLIDGVWHKSDKAKVLGENGVTAPNSVYHLKKCTAVDS